MLPFEPEWRLKTTHYNITALTTKFRQETKYKKSYRCLKVFFRNIRFPSCSDIFFYKTFCTNNTCNKIILSPSGVWLSKHVEIFHDGFYHLKKKIYFHTYGIGYLWFLLIYKDSIGISAWKLSSYERAVNYQNKEE